MRFSRFLALALFAITMSFTACGDDDSSSFVEPEKESSDSSSDSSASVSSSSTNSSSSAKSSSSVNSSAGGSSAKSSSSGKNTSASSSAGESSSSLSKKYQCLAECTEDCEGETYWIGTDHQMICHGGQWLNLDSMENANRSSSSRYYDMTEQFNPDVEYGEFTDPRDGQTYRTVDIYDKVYKTTYTTFAENLNFGKMISGGLVQSDSTKYCYDDDPWYCENGWGGLYTWSNAMGLPSVCDSVKINTSECSYGVSPSKQQGICPEGWHVMNDNEWANLTEISGRDVAYEMGSKVAGFGSKNRYGMSILPAGYWEHTPSRMEHFTNIKMQTFFWLPEQDLKDAEKAKHVNIMSSDMTRGSSRSKYKYAHSIRCVKDY